MCTFASTDSSLSKVGHMEALAAISQQMETFLLHGAFLYHKRWLQNVGCIWTLKISHAQKTTTPYFVLHERSTKEVSIKCHLCSLWHPYCAKSTGNRIPKFIQTILRTCLLKVLIVIRILWLWCSNISSEVWYIWCLRIHRAKSPGGYVRWSP